MQDRRESRFKPALRSKSLSKPGASAMTGIINPDHKRVCDISADAKVVEIRKRDCVTRINANPDGTLKIIHERAGPAESVPST